MKILVIAPSAYHLGGVQNWLDYLLPGMEENDVEVILGLVDGCWHNASDYLEKHPWKSTQTITNPSGSAVGRVRAIAETIEKIQPAIVLSVNIGDTLEAMHHLKYSDPGAPRLVMSVHGIEGDYIAELEHYQDVVDSVVVTNQLTGKLVRTLTRVPEERVFYAPYGVALDVPKAPSNLEDTILWMGRFDQYQKRVLEIPDIVRLLGETGHCWRLIVAGDGPESGTLQDAMPSPPSIQVEFTGSISHDRIIRDILPGCGALLVNSSWETGPITAWEAMAAGVPVVSTNYIGSGAESALVDGVNALLFDIGGIQAAVEHVCSLRNNAALRNQIVEGGHRLVSSRYCRELSVMAWQSAFQKTMVLPPCRPARAPMALPSRGRLDRLLGIAPADFVRQLFGISFRHRSPGSEWPHVLHGMAADKRKSFIETAIELDTPTRPGH